MKIKQFLVSMVVAVLGFLILAGFTEGSVRPVRQWTLNMKADQV